jgi:hypothetical protein
MPSPEAMANIRQATTIEKPVVRRSSAKKVFFIFAPIFASVIQNETARGPETGGQFATDQA